MAEETFVIREGGASAVGRRSVLWRSLAGALALVGVAGAKRSLAAEPGGVTMFDPSGESFRRVVIGNNAQGKSYVVKDEAIKRGEVWKTDPDNPLGPGGAGDPNIVLAALPVPSGGGQASKGTRWFYSAIQPSKAPLDRATIKGWHRVSSVSYVLVTNGEVTLLLDDGQVVLRGGDLLVMRNGLHTWHNATTTPVGLLINQILV